MDKRADVWAFGCVLFEMLAGRHAFGGAGTVSDAIAAVLKSEPDWAGAARQHAAAHSFASETMSRKRRAAAACGISATPDCSLASD